MSDSFFVAFLLPFHVAGGAAIGAALHRIIQTGFAPRHIRDNFFLLLWGVLFGGLPLVFGLTAGVSWTVILQIVLFLGSAVIVAWRYEWLHDLYRQPGMFVATFGLIFAIVGLALTASMLSERTSDSLFIGFIFAGIGGLMFLVGAWLLLRN